MDKKFKPSSKSIYHSILFLVGTQIGLQLRQAMFVNGVLFNTEVCYGLKPKDIEILSIVDHQILRYIIQAHAKTPNEFLYLETGAIPLSFIIASRRMIYLQNILKREPTELVRRVFEAQKSKPTKGDFIELVLEDFELTNITYNENVIIAMGQNEYKSYIKKHIKNAALVHLKTLQATHSKVDYLKYSCLETQSYLTDHVFSNKEAALLTALRSHTLRGLKMNFSSWFLPDLQCSLKCVGEQDSQEHLRTCKPLLKELSEHQKLAVQKVKFEDIYNNPNCQKEAVTIFSLLLDAREKLLEAGKPTSGSSLDAAPPGGNRGLYT